MSHEYGIDSRFFRRFDTSFAVDLFWFLNSAIEAFLVQPKQLSFIIGLFLSVLHYRLRRTYCVINCVVFRFDSSHDARIPSFHGPWCNRLRRSFGFNLFIHDLSFPVARCRCCRNHITFNIGAISIAQEFLRKWHGAVVATTTTVASTSNQLKRSFAVSQVWCCCCCCGNRADNTLSLRHNNASETTTTPSTALSSDGSACIKCQESWLGLHVPV